MQRFFGLLVVIVIISSCSKNKGDGNGSSSVALPDTLSAGWTKISGLPAASYSDISFVDNNTGYAVSTNGIYKSVNGGTDWTVINPLTTMLHVSSGNSSKICFVDGGFSLLQTPDGGTTFVTGSYAYPGGGTVGLFNCFFSTADTCYLTSNQYIWKSVNAGVSMDTIYHFPNISPTSSLFFLDNMSGWILRQDGIYHTMDAGITWDSTGNFTNAYGSIQFLDAANGYFSNYGTINKTTDGGLTWLPVFQSSLQVYADIDFITIDEGYFSLGNRIYKTTDAGSTWTQVAALGNGSFSKIHFTDASHGWASTSTELLKFNQ